MQKYLNQLLGDVHLATENPPQAYLVDAYGLQDWMPAHEEEEQAQKKSLEEWTDIIQDAIPPDHLLTDEQVEVLLDAFKKLLRAYNCHFIMLVVGVPERVQYRALRNGWKQVSPLMRWHEYFFNFCNDEKPTQGCLLGEEYCHCRVVNERISDRDKEEEWSEEEEAAFWREYERNKKKRRRE